MIRHCDQANLGVDVDKTGLGHFLVAPRGMGGLRKATRFATDQAGRTNAWADFAQREPQHTADHLRRGSDIVTAFGGNLEGVEHSITSCVEQVRERVYARVEELGADAVIGLSVSLEGVADKAQAVLMSGTAVRLRPAATTTS